jgi:hypothetical protein
MAEIMQCSAVQIFIREPFKGDLKLYGEANLEIEAVKSVIISCNRLAF